MNSSSISLQKITQQNFAEIIKLDVNESQKGFVASNVYSIAQSTVIDQAECLAIYYKEEPVGFILYDLWEGHWCISRFMIDKDHQGNGFGKEALAKLLERIRDKHDPEAIYLSFVPENTTAQQLYEKAGFEFTGEIEEGEKVYRLKLK